MHTNTRIASPSSTKTTTSVSVPLFFSFFVFVVAVFGFCGSVCVCVCVCVCARSKLPFQRDFELGQLLKVASITVIRKLSKTKQKLIYVYHRCAVFISFVHGTDESFYSSEPNGIRLAEKLLQIWREKKEPLNGIK